MVEQRLRNSWTPLRAMSSSQGLTIGELEANYSLYCKALRLLLKEGKTVAAIQPRRSPTERR